MDLFDSSNYNSPLSDRMRPKTLKDFYGQEHLVGAGKLLEQAIKTGNLFSAILWGPPGSGKTTIAQIIANESDANFVKISAVTSTVADMRKYIEKAADDLRLYSRKTLLFIDEIHRFNKAQQDVLLPHVEAGTVTLIGATTENPSFEVIGPLLSRSRVLVLQPLMRVHLEKIVKAALSDRKAGLGLQKLKIAKDAIEALIIASNGDARFALNTLEIAANLAGKDKKVEKADVVEAMQKKMPSYDKKGDSHYDTISAFIKSMRGGKTDAVLHYLARMIEAGEDPIFIARRMVIFASEDIGNAQPTALVLATSAMSAVHMIGMPEAGLILAQTASYLAEAPKSVASTEAISKAMSDLKLGLDPIPLHLRNAPTKLMEELGYGAGHVRYPWRDDPNLGEQEYMPKNLAGKKYYQNPRNK